MNKNKNIYGFHSVTSLILQDARAIDVVYIDNKRKDKRTSELIKLANEHSIVTNLVETKIIESFVTNTVNHQGVIGVINSNQNISKPDFSLVELLAMLENKSNAVIMLLDGITDPHNLGAIIRTCDCFAVDAIIIPKDNSASINSTVDKVSAGAVNNIPIITVNNLVTSMEKLQVAGFWIAGTSLTDESVELYKFKPSNKIAWVMGNEGSGLRRLVSETCDYLVSIPMLGKTQSLNVSVATGVVLSYTRLTQQK